MTTTTYEWDRETVDPDTLDILDHDHRDRLSEFTEPIGTCQRLVLVRDVWDDCGGLVDRSWAYVGDYALPLMFDDGVNETTKVPKRFFRELAAYEKRMKS